MGNTDDPGNRIPEKVYDWVSSARRPVVFTGAGMSRESGLRTFRGSEGLWKEYRPEELATLEALKRHPEIVWEWYRERFVAADKVVPHDGHFAIVNFEKKQGRFPVITQNVDSLHQKAGSSDVIELHGSLRTASCMNEPGRKYSLTPQLLREIPPRCECGAILRPDIILFGEQLPEQEISRAFQIAGESDLMLVIGTSVLVYPSASLPWIILSNGGKVIEINIERTQLTGNPGVISIHSRAGEVLPEILED